MSLATAYGTLFIREGGRSIEFRLHDSVGQSEHNKRLFDYVKFLNASGYERINCDHVYFDFLDRGLNLNRGRKRLDIMALKKGRVFEFELKTAREIWLDHTIEQLKEIERHSENLILLVPTAEIERTVQLLRSVNLMKTKVDSYEI